MKKFLATSLFVLTAVISYSQDPWMEGNKHGFLRLQFSSLQYDHLLDGFNNSDIGLKREITHNTLQAYLEYGLTDRLDIHLSLPFKMLSTSEALLNPINDNYPLDTVESGNMYAFSNISAGAKYLLATGAFQIAGKLMLGANTTAYDSATGLRSGYDAWLITPSISIGRNYELFYFYTEAGFRIKTNSYSDDLLAKIESGYRFDWTQDLQTWFILFVKADIRNSVGFYEDNRSLHTGLYVDGEGFILPGLRLRQQLTDKLWVDLGISYPVWGEDHAVAPTLQFAALWDW